MEMPEAPSEERKNTAHLFFKSGEAPSYSHGDEISVHVKGVVGRVAEDEHGCDVDLEDVTFSMKGKPKKRTMKEDMQDAKKGKKADNIEDEY